MHGGLGFIPPKLRYGFCANVRAVPVLVSEIPAAIKDYPVIFTSQENPKPLAVVGLVDDINLFVDEEGNWERNRYIPGYVRRYPFGVASDDTDPRCGRY